MEEGGLSALGMSVFLYRLYLFAVVGLCTLGVISWVGPVCGGPSAKYELTLKFTLASQRSFLQKTNKSE